MFKKSSYSLSIIIVLLSISTYAHVRQQGEPMHSPDDSAYSPELLDVEEEFLSNQTRFMQTATYPGLRITPDYSTLVDGSADFISYVKTALYPPVLDYFRSALSVKQPLTSPLKLPTTYKTICNGFTTPSALFTGVSTDLYVLVSSESDTANWVASAGACYLSSVTKRTLVAQMIFNMNYTVATTDPLVHEKNTYLTIHEMMHALGFTGTAFSNFIDASGNTLTGQIKTVTMNGSTRTVLDVEPLTSMLRTYFGCSTLPGAFMEDDGGAGTVGSHFERRHFLYEVMTSGVIYGLRVSQFSLAVLEGSGWYQPNYTYAEPFFWGQGEGCNFLYQDCLSSTFSSYGFDEFCTGSSRGCGPVGEGGGVCSNDTRSDGCRYYIPVYDYDCENPAASDNARFPTLETFGRNAGSRCFQGNVSTLSKSTQTSYCLKYNCVGTGLNTTVQVMFGTTQITCTQESQVKIPGYYGLLNCPDPLTYCNGVGKKYCPRNCMGRGTCVNNVCQCKTGYTGLDCALNA